MKPEDAADFFGAYAANFFAQREVLRQAREPLICLIYGSREDAQKCRVTELELEILPEVAALLLTGGDPSLLAANPGILANLTPDTLTIVEQASLKLAKNPQTSEVFYEPEEWQSLLGQIVLQVAESVQEDGPKPWFTNETIEARLRSLDLID